MTRKIPPAVYEALTSRQRLAATLVAQGRSDDGEISRLLRSQPSHDASLNTQLNWVNGLALAVECDIREAMIGFLIGFDRNEELETSCLQRIANLRKAWSLVMQDIGVHSDDVERASPPCSAFLEVVLPHLPEPDSDYAYNLAQSIKV